MINHFVLFVNRILYFYLEDDKLSFYDIYFCLFCLIFYCGFYEIEEQGVRFQHSALILWVELCAYIPSMIGYLHYLNEVAVGVHSHTLHAIILIFFYEGIIELIAVTVTFFYLFLPIYGGPCFSIQS